MSHFTVMVRYEGKIEDYINEIEGMLESYDENKSVDEYIEYHKRKAKEYLDKEIKRYEEIIATTKINPREATSYNIPNCKKSLEELENKTPEEYFQIISEGYKIDSNGNAVSNCNPDAKWDWYTIGGRWSGLLKLKKGKAGIEGGSGVFNNKTGIDVAYAKDIDWNKMKGFHTFSVLDEDGWHQNSEMGWFGISYNKTEDEKIWKKKFKQRFLSDFTDETVIAIVDCHI